MITIGKRELKEDDLFIIFEAGPTHSGLDSAKQLVDVAVEAGADAIKFQMVDADRLMAERDVRFRYKILVGKAPERFEEKEEPLYEILKRRELKREEWTELKGYCDAKGIEFISTVLFPEDVDFLVDDLGVSSLKIASADLNYFALIEYAARKGVNIQLDTGSSELWEIERAVRIVENCDNENIIIHHCPSGYPAHLESIHLRMIKTLKTLFPKYIIGFSDHTPNWEMDVSAFTLGATVIEKTITLDRTIPSIEHCFSLEPSEARQFVRIMNDVKKALGEPRRTLSREGLQNRLKARRSAYTKRPLSKGAVLTPEDIEFKRPGYGIPPDMVDFIVGKKINKDLEVNTMIRWEDIC